MVGMEKEPIKSDQWPVEIGEQMAAVHRIYLAEDTTTESRLVEPFKFAEDSCRL